MLRDVNKIFISIRFALKGLRHAAVVDKSFRMEIFYGASAYVLVGWYLWPMTIVEAVALVCSYLFILIVELINTAIETMLNRLHPDEHEAIRRSKDIAAAAVLLSFIIAGLIVGTLCYERLFGDRLPNDYLCQHDAYYSEAS